ncbi:MAG TPA: PaaI family thioesterase [Bacteroidetes bacterium]|nr:PaaI family thioesterase [Bacteroidota bacterium]
MKKIKASVEELNKLNKGTMMEMLHIEYLEADDGYFKARMPVNERTKQPAGILHGGATLALAETIAGLGSAIIVDLNQYEVRGSQVSANHVGTAHSGWVYAEARLIHRGRNTHVWNIDIKDEDGRMVSTCRITNFIIRKDN